MFKITIEKIDKKLMPLEEKITVYLSDQEEQTSYIDLLLRTFPHTKVHEQKKIA